MRRTSTWNVLVMPLRYISMRLFVRRRALLELDHDIGHVRRLIVKLGLSSSGRSNEQSDTVGCPAHLANSCTAQGICVKIVHARDLHWVSTKSLDAYCVCAIDGKPSSRFKTNVVGGTCNPNFNYEQRLRRWEPGEALRFEIWDRDWQRDQIIAKVTLRSEHFHPHGFNGDVVLQDASFDVSKPPTLRIAVKVINDATTATKA